MGSKRLTPTRVGKMASKCLLLLLLLLLYVFHYEQYFFHCDTIMIANNDVLSYFIFSIAVIAMF